MAWTIDTRDISRVNNLTTAERVWNAAVPWRNEHTSWRQLGGRRHKHKRLVKLSNDGGYQCVLFSTPVVTYYADGKVALRCHDTTSTQRFAWCVRPNWMRPESHCSDMFWKVDTPDGERFYREGREPLVLAPVAGNYWELITEPKQMVEWKYDPKLGADVRKKLKPFCAWAELTTRILGHYHKRYAITGTRHDVGYLLAHPDDIEVYPKMFELFGYSKHLIDSAYLATGARSLVPAPFDRLPRKQR